MKSLILVPTQMERLRLSEHLPSISEHHSLEQCGFGPIAAAAVSAKRLSEREYQQVFLVGIAGTYHANRVAIGQAYRFDRVQCYGVGVGSGKSFQSSSELGWNQLDQIPVAGRGCQVGESGEKANESKLAPWQPEDPASTQDLIDLKHLVASSENSGVASPEKSLTLLTGCTASADRIEAQERAARYPSAMAEDMEGFGVAMACQLYQKPLCIIRGISNQAGNRDHTSWKTEQAMQSVAKLLATFL